jgi:hypothetical protein
LLAAYGLTENSVKQHLDTEALILDFLDARLRPTVRIQPEDIEAYYHKEFASDARKAGTMASLSAAQSEIRELLIQQRINELLETWLYNLRQQAEIQSNVPLPPQDETKYHQPTAGAQ